jgi:hypothetical protein
LPEFAVFLTYINPDPYNLASVTEPCLALCRRHHGQGFTYAIPLSRAYDFATNAGHPTEHLFQTARQIAAILGLGPEKFEIHKIIDAVVDNLQELVEAEPWEIVRNRTERRPEHNAEVVLRDGMGNAVKTGTTALQL